MRRTSRLITILPAIPPAIGEVKYPPGRSRVLLRVLAVLLALVALVTALLLSLPVSSA